MDILEMVESSVGAIIVRQMGGTSRLGAMIGAKNFMTGLKDGGAIDGLSFKFMNQKGSKKPNYVKVLLMPDDTYTVEFGSIRGYNYKVLKTVENVFAGELKRVFEKYTGLRLTL